jgi:hypothetical protein
MTVIAEKIVVLAKEFLETKNINDSRDFNEPLYQTKLNEFDWDLAFAAPSAVCELIWKAAIRGGGMTEYRRLDRIFSPSPLATHANFRGCASLKTGNNPEIGSIAFWKKGNGWQGHMAIVVGVSEDKKTFDIIEGKVLSGSENKFLMLELKKGKRTDLPFKNDKLNLIGFGYPPDREIS